MSEHDVVGYRIRGVRLAELEAAQGSMPAGEALGASSFVASGSLIGLTGQSALHAQPMIGFTLLTEVATPATVMSVLAATASVCAALAFDDASDAPNGGPVLLGPTAVHPSELVDLRLLGCVLRVDGVVVDSAAGAAAFGHPAAAVAWLANDLAERGETLPAGSLVLSGGLTAGVALTAGHSVTVELDGLGAVEAYA